MIDVVHDDVARCKVMVCGQSADLLGLQRLSIEQTFVYAQLKARFGDTMVHSSVNGSEASTSAFSSLQMSDDFVTTPALVTNATTASTTTTTASTTKSASTTTASITTASTSMTSAPKGRKHQHK